MVCPPMRQTPGGTGGLAGAAHSWGIRTVGPGASDAKRARVGGDAGASGTGIGGGKPRSSVLRSPDDSDDGCLWDDLFEEL